MLCDYCARGDAKRAARLLERLPRGGRYRDLADYDKRSPAHLAAAHGRTEILRLLDEYGLALDGVDIFGGTPLYDAAVKAHDADAAVDFLRERCGPLVVGALEGMWRGGAGGTLARSCGVGGAFSASFVALVGVVAAAGAAIPFTSPRTIVLCRVLCFVALPLP